MRPLSNLPFLVLPALLLTSCSVKHVNQVGAQASTKLPVSSQVAEVQLPYDPSLPTFVLAVEPFANGTQSVYETSVDGYDRCAQGQCQISSSYRNLGNDVSSQLVTALLSAGNISLLDPAAIKKSRDGTYQAKSFKGERGPYIVRGTLTELSENVESNSEDDGISLGWIGLIAGVAGAVAGEPGLGWTGAGVAAANPSFGTSLSRRTGMVAFDIQIIDASSLRIVGGFRAAGTFTGESAESGFTLLGVHSNRTEFAQSVLGQAMRVAMNDAVSKIVQALAHSPRANGAKIGRAGA